MDGECLFLCFFLLDKQRKSKDEVKHYVEDSDKQLKPATVLHLLKTQVAKRGGTLADTGRYTADSGGDMADTGRDMADSGRRSQDTHHKHLFSKFRI